MPDLTLQTLIEFRGEVREFRDETRKALAQNDHRLSLLIEEIREFRREMREFRGEMLNRLHGTSTD